MKDFEKVEKHAKFYEKLNSDLDKSIKEVNEGKFYGPFDSAKELMASLKSNKLK